MASSDYPLGFDGRAQFLNAVAQIRAAAQAEDVVTGVRGSAATGASATTGATSGDDSDIDFFLVSDTLFAFATAAGAREHNGALRVGATPRFFPSLHQVEIALSEQIGRKVTVRVFNRAGYDLVKAATDIEGE